MINSKHPQDVGWSHKIDIKLTSGQIHESEPSSLKEGKDRFFCVFSYLKQANSKITVGKGRCVRITIELSWFWSWLELKSLGMGGNIEQNPMLKNQVKPVG